MGKRQRNVVQLNKCMVNWKGQAEEVAGCAKSHSYQFPSCLAYDRNFSPPGEQAGHIKGSATRTKSHCKQCFLFQFKLELEPVLDLLVPSDLKDHLCPKELPMPSNQIPKPCLWACHNRLVGTGWIAFSVKGWLLNCGMSSLGKSNLFFSRLPS